MEGSPAHFYVHVLKQYNYMRMGMHAIARVRRQIVSVGWTGTPQPHLLYRARLTLMRAGTPPSVDGGLARSTNHTDEGAAH